MTDFQNKVNPQLAKGIPGAFASVNPIVSTAAGYTAASDTQIGGFCWYVSPGKAEGKGAGAPLGFVALDRIYPLYGAGTSGNVVPKGCALCVQTEGDFYVIAPAAVTIGAKVYADGATGAIAESGIETGFFYATAGDAGDTVIISSGNAPAAPGDGEDGEDAGKTE